MVAEQINLANTGLKTARLGLGTAYGLKAADIVWAVENGLNYIFWGSFRRSSVPKAVKMLGPARRDDIILVSACYGHKLLNTPQVIRRSLERALQRLKVDYLDIFQLGYISAKPSDEIVEALLKLRREGLFRHLAFSTHNRQLAAEIIKENYPFKIAMVRYNAAHRGAEKEIFPYLDLHKQALVSFTATRWGDLLKPPKGWPVDKPVPTAVDCYRFVLSHPKVTLCLSGAKNRRELRENLKALDLGPMSEEELLWMKEFGDFVYSHKRQLKEKLSLDNFNSIFLYFKVINTFSNNSYNLLQKIT